MEWIVYSQIRELAWSNWFSGWWSSSKSMPRATSSSAWSRRTLLV
ncbi:hypothetical protein [Paenibacillus sp. P3E]|nr:hypothetical protein [Paenibacillus sp. P3E]